jgi:tRNA G37 N-methylase Trm5
MRHLRVPKRETQTVFEALLRAGLLAQRGRILHDGDFTLVPVDGDAPLQLGGEFTQFEEVEAEQPEAEPHRWIERLPEWLSEDVIAEHEGIWPSSQELLGDLLVFKVEREVSDFSQQIALAKISHVKGARLALRDHGVGGEFRVRELEPLAARHEGEVIDASQIADLEEEARATLLTTRTLVREHMRSIRIDPSKAYFSPRLQGERWKTVESAERLREILGRPLAVADPYCGVGPALVHLIKRRGLVGELLASDLNPDAVELLFDNIRRWGAPNIPEIQAPLTEVSPGWRVGVADALTLKEDPEVAGSYDLLLVNIPHDTMQHLPHLLPLLRRGSPTLVRGWVVAAEDDLTELNQTLQEVLQPRLPGLPTPTLEKRRQYNSTEWLCRFEAWLQLPN